MKLRGNEKNLGVEILPPQKAKLKKQKPKKTKKTQKTKQQKQ